MSEKQEFIPDLASLLQEANRARENGPAFGETRAQEINSPLISEENQCYYNFSGSVQVTELAPTIFENLRQRDGISRQDIQASFDPLRNLKAISNAGESQGKSGSFFFFSGDKRFIIKTMTKSDLETFKKIFRQYVRHVEQHQDSLLARIYGVYSIKMQDMDPISIVLMENTKRTFDDETTLMYTFDLKGSQVNRESKPKKGIPLKPTSCRKDLNIINMTKEEKFLFFSQ